MGERRIQRAMQRLRQQADDYVREQGRTYLARPAPIGLTEFGMASRHGTLADIARDVYGVDVSGWRTHREAASVRPKRDSSR